jgi:hypothetical protein
VHYYETLKKMKHKLLILGLCIAVTISGAYSGPGPFSFGRSGGGWFTSSKQTVPKYTAFKPSAPTYSSLNMASNAPTYGWNFNKPVGPGLGKVSVGSYNAPPAYFKTALTLDKSPPPYSSINHLGSGVSSGPPPPYFAFHPPAPAPAQRSSFGSSKGGGLFSSSKQTLPKYTAPKLSAPNYSSLNKGSNAPAYGWNLNKPVGPPPAYPGLEKVSVGSHIAPPAYSKTAPSFDKRPSPYSSINYLGTGVYSLPHLRPPPPYSALHPPAPSAYNTGFHVAQPPVTILNNYPAPAQGSSFGNSLASNALFYGLGSMNSHGSSVHHLYHNSDSRSRNFGASGNEVTSTSSTTTVPTIENLTTVINVTDKAPPLIAPSSLSSSEPTIPVGGEPVMEAKISDSTPNSTVSPN